MHVCACIQGVCLAFWAQGIWGAVLWKHWELQPEADWTCALNKKYCYMATVRKMCLTSSLGTSSCLLSNSELHWSLFLIHKLGQLCRLYEVWVIQYQHPSNRVVVLSYKPLDENEQQFSFLAPHSMQKVMQKATSPVRRTERNRWKISKSRNLAKKWSKYITWSSSKTLTQYLSASRLNCLCTSHFIHSITQSLLLGHAILKS